MTQQNVSRSIAFSDSHVELACFEVHGNIVAIDVLQIREIVRWQDVTPLPRAPALIEGVVDLRGAVIPVVDLGRALGGESVGESNSARIVVLEVDGMVLGLRVEAATVVLSVESSSLEEPPSLVTSAGYEAVRAVVRREKQPPVMVLSLENLVENVYRSALAKPDDEE